MHLAVKYQRKHEKYSALKM